MYQPPLPEGHQPPFQPYPSSQPGFVPQQQPYTQPRPEYPPMPTPGYQQPQPVYPPQQAGYPQPMMYPQQQMPVQPLMVPPSAIMQNNINVNVQQSGPGFFMRALYFLFVGWWAGYIWLSIGFGLCALIITLPLGLMMLNRLPQVMTLKQPGTSTSVNVNTVAVQQAGGPAVMMQNINVNVGVTQQQNFLIRALYFLLVGWWAGYIWANLAYFCCLTLILLPVGVMMFDRLPLVLTLRRN